MYADMIDSAHMLLAGYGPEASQERSDPSKYTLNANEILLFNVHV